MKSTKDIVAASFGPAVETSGVCQTHGASSVKAIGPGGWYCVPCMETTLTTESRRLWETERHAHLKRVADIPAKYLGQEFKASGPAQKGARGTVKAFRDFLLKNRCWAVLVLSGLPGTGKTLMACEFAQALIDNCGWQVRYCTAKGMISEIQASYGTDGKSEAGEIERFVRYEVLILDEIDVKGSGANSNVLLTEVINRRYNDGRPVVIITNQAFDTLAEFVGDRVLDRLYENSFVAEFAWPSFRRAK